MQYEKRIEALLERLVCVASDTGTIKEKAVEEVLINILDEIPYFKRHKEDKGFYAIEEDLYERGIVWAMVKGESKRAIVLMHHHDVVDSNDYGELSPFAYDMEAIQNKLGLKKDLPTEVRKDIESNEWLFGRGSADMKAGAAIQLALLEAYSKQEVKPYHLILLSVPDEENMSIGMRKGTALLRTLKETYGLEYELLINSEPHERESKSCGTLYTGSVGKLMPVVYVRGKSTHIGNVYGGFNPLLVAEKMASKIELNTDFCDVIKGEVTLPPSVVYFKDRKTEYNVSTPQSMGFYFSLLLLKSSVDEVLEKLQELAKEAFGEAIHQIQKSYENYSLLNKAEGAIEKSNKDDDMLGYKVNVQSFEEIYEIAKEAHGYDFEESYKAYQQEVKKQIDGGKITLPESTFLLIEKVLTYVPCEDPVAVLAFSPPYYPSVHHENSELVASLSTFAKANWQETYQEKQYFMGISDMSYVGNHLSESAIQSLSANMPQWQGIYEVPFEDMKAIQMPMINIGPWGKDLHQYSERVYKKDVLKHTPKLLAQLLRIEMDI